MFRRRLIDRASSIEMLLMEPTVPSSTALPAQAEVYGHPLHEGFKCQEMSALGWEMILGSLENKKKSREDDRSLISTDFKSDKAGVETSNPPSGGSHIAAVFDDS